MNRKKLMGAALAALVGLGMLGALPAAADPGDADNITITGAKVVGRTFTAYKLADYEQVWIPDKATGKLARVNLVTDVDIKGAVSTWLTTTTASTIPKYDGTIDPLTWIAENWTSDGSATWSGVTSTAPNVRALATWLAGQTLTELTPVTMPAATGTTTAELDVTEGLWLVIDKTGDGATTTQSLPIIMGTKFMDGKSAVVDDKLADTLEQPAATIAVKGDLVEIDKDIVQSPDTDTGFASELTGTVPGDALSGTEDEDSTTASTGDTVSFRIRTNVPLYPDTFLSPTFEIHDTWSDGLTPDLATIKVKAEGEPDVELDEKTSDAGDYTVTDNEDGSFTIKILNPKDAKVAGKVLTVTYDATVDTAPVAPETHTWDTNTAHAKFTNEWAVNSDGKPMTSGEKTDETPKDEVDVYTFALDIRKADLNDTSTFLAATFLVRDAALKVIGMVTTNTAGDAAYITGVAYDQNANPQYTATDAPMGLADGAWYHVEEYGVPTGYTPLNTDVAKFSFYLDANHAEGDDDDALQTKEVAPKYYFASGAVDPLPGEWSTPYVKPIINWDAEAEAEDGNDLDVLVLNAKSASDMPSTGGQILLWGGIAGALGLGAVTFAGLGLRKRKATA